MKTPFELLGVEARFDLSEATLDQRQKELSLELHPDRFAGRPAAERRAALNLAIEVNAAHRLLKDPIQRGEALLRAMGVEIDEATEPPAEPAFLMEMMEARESLREWGQKEEVEKIESALEKFQLRQAETIENLTRLFSGLDIESSDSISTVRQALAPLRYFRRYFDEANAYLDELI